MKSDRENEEEEEEEEYSYILIPEWLRVFLSMFESILIGV